MTSTPWQPRGDGVESTAFVMPPDLGVKGRVRPPPGLERVEEEEAEGNVELEDMVPDRSESVTEQDLLIYCFKMTMIELLLKWIMRHLRRLENRQERVRGLIQMHLRLSRQLSK
eukprot:s6609_g4.t1